MDDKRTPSPPGRGRRSARRRLPASERRVLILDAALEAFATNGYDGAAMEGIAAAAGISKAVVYDHVSSKRELYTVLLDEICADLVGVVEAALTPAGPAGEARVRIATDAFFAFVEDHPQASRLLVLELQGANVSTIGRELEERLTAGITAQLAAAQLLAGHPQREQQLAIFAELLKSAVQGLASWWFRHPAIPRHELVERTVAFLWPAIRRAAG
jgi:AcrR family transcriptional regulator